MVFHDKYELLAIRNGDREIAMAGREILSGRPLVVHLLGDPQGADVRRLLDQLNSLTTEERQQVLEIGDHEGIPYVVTAVLPGKLGIRSWIDALQPLVSTEASVATPTEEHGEVVQSIVPAPPDSSSELGRPAPGSGQPGEFTRIFIKPQENAPSSSDALIFPLNPSAIVPPPDKPTEAGEFTRLVGSPTNSGMGRPQEPQTPAQPDPATEGPGDFTRMLQSPLEAVNGRAARPEPEPVRRASKFTRIIQADELPPMPDYDRQPAAGPEFSSRPFAAGGGMTRLLESPFEHMVDSVPQSVPLHAGTGTGAVAVAGQDASREPGEFTRIFVMSPDSGSAHTPAPSPEPRKEAAQPAVSCPQPLGQMPKAALPAVTPSHLGAQSIVDRARRNKNKLPLFLILAGLSLLFVILALVFALMQ
jgi:hypothetical protein